MSKIKAYLLSERNRYKQEYWPYYDLCSAVIILGLKDKDTWFFKSERFEYLCNIMGVDSEVILESLPDYLKRGIK